MISPISPGEVFRWGETRN